MISKANQLEFIELEKVPCEQRKLLLEMKG